MFGFPKRKSATDARKDSESQRALNIGQNRTQPGAAGSPAAKVCGTWLVVGLGNPGDKYAWTRHNVGFMAVDELASRASVSFSADRSARADVATTQISGAGFGIIGSPSAKVVLVKPRTYMNESGISVAKLASFYKVDPKQIIVIHDELDLDLGRMKLKIGGGDNGHNGLKSVRAHLKTGDYNRIRMGIGRPPGSQSGADYVLSKIPSSLRPDFEVSASVAADAATTLITSGLEVAQNRFNR